MQGDFSRDSFDPMKNFTRVLQQQGRVQLDADWNEQVSIFWHQWRTFIKDLIGPYGGPEKKCGFGIYMKGDTLSKADGEKLTAARLEAANGMLKDMDAQDFLIGPGNYYVGGTLCSNPDVVLFSQQGDRSKLAATSIGNYLIYIDIWERHITSVEDDSIREVALGVETCTRAKIEWQVRSWPIPNDSLFSSLTKNDLQNQWDAILAKYFWPGNRGRLVVQTVPASDKESAEINTDHADSRYRGSQNQLYRIEIHKPGTASSGASFKWSRENGSVVFPIVSPINGSDVIVGHLGKDGRSALKVGDWAEIVDDDCVIKRLPGDLTQIDAIDTFRKRITLKPRPTTTAVTDMSKHPLMRRWDQKSKLGESTATEKGVAVREGAWLTLENGIQIQFKPNADQPNNYQIGDYWLIPTRITTGVVGWPRSSDNPDGVKPHGIDHYFAPLAIFKFDGKNWIKDPSEIRPTFSALL